jgi:anti-sigma factor ChrR (cupin superfamily)
MGTLALGLRPAHIPAARVAAIKARVLEKVRSLPQRDFSTIRFHEGEWSALAAGIDFKLLYIDPERRTRSFLLRMAPDTTLPGHDHAEDEECLVLEGEVQLGDVHVRAGDYHMAPKGLAHGAIYSKTGCLLYLRAAA